MCPTTKTLVSLLSLMEDMEDAEKYAQVMAKAAVLKKQDTQCEYGRREAVEIVTNLIMVGINV